MTRDAKFSLIAGASGVLVGGLLIGLELVGIDWAGVYRTWFGFVLWTGVMFGLFGIAYGRHLKRLRSLAVFLTIFLVHVVLFTLYLRSADHLPEVAVLFGFPLEGGVIGLVMGTVGGTRLRRSYRVLARRQK
jgi:hypothetical protein